MMFKDLPTEILNMCYKKAREQGVNLDPKAGIRENKRHGGFSWLLTEEGQAFWEDVLSNKNYNRFYEKYPKNSELLIQCL
jgi:hypothetical protein